MKIVHLPDRTVSPEPFPEAHDPGDRILLVAGGRDLGSVTRREAKQMADVFRAFDLPVLADAFDRVAGA